MSMEVVVISSYRIYQYPMKQTSFRHIYFKRTLGFRGLNWGNRKKRGEAGHEEKLDPSLSRSRRIVRDLILCNQFSYFCTFTFNPNKVDRLDFKACKKKITKLFNHYKERYSPSFRYVLIPERHKDGAWHFHGLLSGIRSEDFVVPEMIWVHPFKNRETLIQVPNKHGYVDWAYYSKKLGFFNCSLIQNYERCASYVSKYITKDLASVMPGARVVLASENLRRPELVFDCDGIPCEFKPEYEDDFCKMTWAGEGFTIGKYVTLWYDECCAELQDPPETFYEDNIAQTIFIPLTGQQLKI